MEARVKWAEGRTFLGTSTSGHSITFGNAYGEGEKPGPSAMEMILMGVGGCSAYDVISILEKSRQDVKDVDIVLTSERAETDPKVFTKVHLHFVVTGTGVDSKRVERAIGLSVDKYCSASAMVAKTAEVTHGFEIVEAG